MNPFSAQDFVINYILLPVFLIFIIFYKFWNKTKWVKLEEMDIWTGRREFSEEEEPIKDKSWLKRVCDIVVG